MTIDDLSNIYMSAKRKHHENPLLQAFLLALITAFCIAYYIYTIRCLENILVALDAIEEDVLVLDWESATQGRRI